MTRSFLATFDERWTIACLADGKVELRDIPATPDDAAGIKAALGDLGYHDEGVCLALASRSAMSAAINCTDLPRGHRRGAMLCLLEEQLPLDLEAVAADFLPSVEGSALGVAVELTAVRTMIDTIGSAGAQVVAVCPAALLSLWELCRGEPVCDYALIAWGQRTDVFRLKQGRPVAWHGAGDDVAEVVECITVDQLVDPIAAAGATAIVMGSASWTVETVEAKAGLKILRRIDEPALAAAVRATQHLADANPAGWVNLRRDALAMDNPWSPLKPYLRSAAMMAVLLPIVLAAVFAWRGWQYNTLAEQAYFQEAATYQKLNPGRAVPVGLNLRLRSDLDRLKGISGTSRETPRRVNALETLRQIISTVPESIRLRLLEMKVNPSDVFIDGQTRTHGDAELVNKSLLEAGFVMDPPRTENLPGGGVSSSLAGKIVAGVVASEVRPAAAEPVNQPAGQPAPIPAAVPTPTQQPADQAGAATSQPAPPKAQPEETR